MSSTAALGSACRAAAMARSTPTGAAPGRSVDGGGSPKPGRDEWVTVLSAGA